MKKSWDLELLRRLENVRWKISTSFWFFSEASFLLFFFLSFFSLSQEIHRSRKFHSLLFLAGIPKKIGEGTDLEFPRPLENARWKIPTSLWFFLLRNFFLLRSLLVIFLSRNAPIVGSNSLFHSYVPFIFGQNSERIEERFGVSSCFVIKHPNIPTCNSSELRILIPRELFSSRFSVCYIFVKRRRESWKL